MRRAFEDNFRVDDLRKLWRQMRRERFDVARCTIARLTRAMGLAGALRGSVSRLRTCCARRHVTVTHSLDILLAA
jgi:putative transposase